MNKVFKILFNYILIFTGLIITSWVIWARFIRERKIRDIPEKLTEYRFWILLYLIYIYIVILKNLIKSSEKNIPGIKEIINLIYTPLTALDHEIKYNKYMKPKYYTLMDKFISSKDKLTDYEVQTVMFFLQILPRLILVIFLLLDTFYFHKLEIFYKVVLIGLLPFIYKYINYSCKDIYEVWIKELEDKYECVRIYEDGYKHDDARKQNTKAIYHHEKKTIREYIEIKWDNWIDYISDDVDYLYEATPYSKQNVREKYLMDKYKTTKILYTIEDIHTMNALYFEYMPKILKLKKYIRRLEVLPETPLIKRSKIIIFSIYLICWSYILITCYKYNPIELLWGKYFLANFMRYLEQQDNPFSELFWGSRNINLINKETIKNIFNYILNRIRNKFK